MKALFLLLLVFAFQSQIAVFALNVMFVNPWFKGLLYALYLGFLINLAYNTIAKPAPLS